MTTTTASTASLFTSSRIIPSAAELFQNHLDNNATTEQRKKYDDAHSTKQQDITLDINVNFEKLRHICDDHLLKAYHNTCAHAHFCVNESLCSAVKDENARKQIVTHYTSFPFYYTINVEPMLCGSSMNNSTRSWVFMFSAYKDAF